MNKGNVKMGCLPKFFKVYLPDESGDDLTLPISFNSFIPNPLPRKVIVKSISGKVWKLEFRRRCYGGEGDNGEEFLMVNGWKRIVKDEDLTGGEFLEFEFDGSRLFHFCVYGYATCKRLRSLGESDDGSHKPSDDDDDDDDQECSDEDTSRDSDYGEDDKSSEDVIVIDNDESDDGQDDDDDDDAEDDDEKQYLDDRENPSFSKTLNPKKKSQLRIPAHVVKDYDLTFPESITIVDPLGTIARKIKIQSNGCVFVRRFGSVIRRNQVKTTDKMIFEIKKTERNVVHTMKVYIIRG